MATSYHLSNIRTLLLEGFSEAELRDFCFDTPEFRPVHHELAELTGKATIVRHLLEYAERRELLDSLLAWAKTQNPVQYNQHQPYQVTAPRPAPPPRETPGKGSPPTPGTLHSVQRDMEMATATPPDRVTITTTLHLELVRVPAGEFLMGSDPIKDEDAQSGEYPQHRVYVSEYYIGKYPMTNEQYAAFVKATKHKAPENWKEGKIPPGKENHPVVNISWDDVVTFCQWLSQATGQPFRLPTEAEWEKAARGMDGRIYPWGNEWNPIRLNSREKGPRDTTPVGKYSPDGDSPYGAADMAGNVWEWCADWYDKEEYQRRARTVMQDPQGPSQGQYRVLRGGTWGSHQAHPRCACRGGYPPDHWDNFRGVRVAVSLF